MMSLNQRFVYCEHEKADVYYNKNMAFFIEKKLFTLRMTRLFMMLLKKDC